MATPTLTEKIGNWYQAFEAVRDTITPRPLREIVNFMTTPVPEGTSPDVAMQRIQASMDIARLVAAGDRVAAQVAAMLASSPTRSESDKWPDPEPGIE